MARGSSLGEHCEQCDGTGEGPDEYTLCTVCEGQGTVFDLIVRQAIERVAASFPPLSSRQKALIVRMFGPRPKSPYAAE